MQKSSKFAARRKKKNSPRTPQISNGPSFTLLPHLARSWYAVGLGAPRLKKYGDCFLSGSVYLHKTGKIYCNKVAQHEY